MSSLPPPPVLASSDPTSVAPTMQNRIGSAFGHILAAGMNHPYEETSIGKAIQQNQQQRLADAQRHHHAAVAYATALGMGTVDPATGMPTGVDPSTGQPMTPQQRQQYTALMNGAMQDYNKAAGVSKEAKESLQRHQTVLQTLANKGIGVVKKIMDAVGGGSMPPPPETQTDLQAPAVAQGVEQQQALDAYKQKAAIDTEAKIKEEQAKPPATSDKYQFITQPDGTVVAVDKSDPNKVIAVKTPNGASINAQTKPGAAPKIMSVDGVPMGIARNGMTLTPDSPGWTTQDQKLFDNAQEAYKKGEATKTQRQIDATNRYAQMRGQVYQYNVIDKTTGEPVMRNANEINKDPDRYGSAGITQQLKNRAAIFDEIDYTRQQAETAISKLGNKPFDTQTQAQLALVLKDRDPASAFSQFMGSEFGKSLTPDQIDYVTALISLQESAMSLRSIGGMGGGSDKLRGAIVAMLPGPATPSKAYAERQMSLFKGELDQLRRAVPQDNSIGLPGSNSSSSAPKPPTPTPKNASEYLQSIGVSH